MPEAASAEDAISAWKTNRAIATSATQRLRAWADACIRRFLIGADAITQDGADAVDEWQRAANSDCRLM